MGYVLPHVSIYIYVFGSVSCSVALFLGKQPCLRFEGFLVGRLFERRNLCDWILELEEN